MNIKNSIDNKGEQTNRQRAAKAFSYLAAISAGGTLLAGTLSSSGVRAEVTEHSLVPLEEVVVTAQKRTESLQDVPISVQVISGQQLTEQNLTNVVTLSELHPSVHVAGSGRSSTYYIRGTGSGESQSFDQSVGTFIDNIYHGRSRYSAATFVDIEHVEILKGPQSTFFGNSAIAGAFNIVTRKPEREPGGWVRGLVSPEGSSGGNYSLEGALNLPLSETTALRLAGIASGQEGWLENVHTGDRAPKEDNYAVRGTFLFEPDDKLRVLLKGEIGDSVNKGGLILRQESCPPPEPFTAAGFCALNLATGAPIGLDTKDFVANDGGEIKLETFGTVLTVDYALGEHTFTSTTGYNGYDYHLDLDNDGTAQVLLNVQAPEDYRQFSQELRIASPSGGRLEYMAGLYYQNAELDIEQSVSYFFVTPAFSGIPGLAGYLPLGQQVNALQDEEIYSAFGSLSWRFNDQWRITLGLRGSVVSKDFDWRLIYGTATQEYGGIVRLPAEAEAIAGGLGLGNIGTVDLDRQDEALMPSVKLLHQFNDDIMGYAGYSRGFKSGGFSVADTSADPANYPFEPEYVDAFEIGLKSELAEGRVKLNLALFYNEFSDLQVSIQGTNEEGGLINIVRNAAKSRSQGLEAEFQWLVNRYFKLSGTATLLDSEYDSYPNAAPTYEQQFRGETTQDLSGRPTLYSPDWSGNIAATLTLPVRGDSVLTAEVTGIFSSDYFTYSTDDPLAVQDSYSRLDARLSLELGGGHWGFDLIGRNLTDETVINFSGYQPTAFGSLFQGQEPPRQIMVQARYEF